MRINIGEFLTRRSRITPDREGLVCEDVRRTYQDLNVRANCLANAMTALGVGHGDRVGILAFNEPEYYDMYFGLGKIGATLVPVNYRLAGPPWVVHSGGKVVLLRTLDPQRFLELIEEEKISGFGSVPQLLDFLKFVPDFEKYDWSSIKTILVYAAPVPVTLIKEYEASGIEVRQLYGLTECNTGTVLDSENAIEKVGSCGRPFFHTEVRVVDENGQDLPPEEKGEVLLRAPNMMKGYLNRPDETAAAIKDGWLYTGDIAKMDADGFLYILDRKKDMIISGGENIYPAEIEDALLSNPKVADVGVIGYPHEKWGEAVKAIVVVQEGQTLTEDELIEWCQGKIGRFKIPKSVVITDAIPRTPTGKILKTELRKQFN